MARSLETIKKFHSLIPELNVEFERRLDVFGTVPADYDLGNGRCNILNLRRIAKCTDKLEEQN